MAQSQHARCQDCGTPLPGDHREPDSRMTCYCSLEDLIDVLSRKHALQIIAELSDSAPRRYSPLSEAIGPASEATLSTTLKALVDADLVDRTQYDEIPPRVEYELTPRGQALVDHLRTLKAWHDEYE